MLSSFGALKRQALDLKAKSLFQEAEPRAHAKSLSYLSGNIGNKLGHLCAKICTGTLRNFLGVERPFSFLLAKEVRKLRLNGHTSTYSRQSLSQQLHQHAVQTQHHGLVVFPTSLVFYFEAKHYTFSLLSPRYYGCNTHQYTTGH